MQEVQSDPAPSPAIMAPATPARDGLELLTHPDPIELDLSDYEGHALPPPYAPISY
jgi:hypothetical protein